MIRNLNQLDFRAYGIIPMERVHGGQTATVEGSSRMLELQEREALPVYRAAEDTWVRNEAGMTVLSVSVDGDYYQSFYLDKTVCLKTGVYFTLAAFRQKAAVTLTSHQEPEITGDSRPADSVYLSHQIRAKGLCTFFYQDRERGFFFPGEVHPVTELTYVDQGILHSVVEGRDVRLRQGDMAVYGPNQWHMQYADSDTAASFVTITFDLEGSDLAPLLNRKFQAPQPAVALLKQMLLEKERDDPYAGDMILALLDQLLLTLLRDLDAPNIRLRTGNAIHSENKIIRRAQQYISAHIREKLTVPVVARNADVSSSYLTALFHKNLQISPAEYIRRVKLQESKQMIRENNMNFTEIAAALNYSTVHHFSRQFKEKFGITPTEYAKSIR